MINTQSIAFVGSVAIHLAIFSAFSVIPTEKQPPQSKQETVVTVSLVPLEDGSGDSQEEKLHTGYSNSVNGCKNDDVKYLGIGVKFDWQQIVTHAPVYYPGYRAGIRIGDQITNDEIGLTHDGFVELDILRNGQQLKFRVKSEDICTREG
jgi:hypothetical protein